MQFAPCSRYRTDSDQMLNPPIEIASYQPAALSVEEQQAKLDVALEIHQQVRTLLKRAKSEDFTMIVYLLHMIEKESSDIVEENLRDAIP